MSISRRSVWVSTILRLRCHWGRTRPLTSHMSGSPGIDSPQQQPNSRCKHRIIHPFITLFGQNSIRRSNAHIKARIVFEQQIQIFHLRHSTGQNYTSPQFILTARNLDQLNHLVDDIQQTGLNNRCQIQQRDILKGT